MADGMLTVTEQDMATLSGAVTMLMSTLGESNPYTAEVAATSTWHDVLAGTVRSRLTTGETKRESAVMSAEILQVAMAAIVEGFEVADQRLAGLAGSLR